MKRTQAVNLELEDLAGVYDNTSKTEIYITELEVENERLRAANLDCVDVCEQALQAKAAAEQERDKLQAELDRLREQHESYMSNMNDGWFEMEQERDQLKYMLFSLADVCDAVFEWVDSVPAETVLPTMPGFDRDWANQIRQHAKEVQS